MWYVGVWGICACVCIWPQRPKEGTRFHGAWITGSSVKAVHDLNHLATSPALNHGSWTVQKGKKKRQHLTKQHHQLGAKFSNPWAYGGRFVLEPHHTNFSYYTRLMLTKQLHFDSHIWSWGSLMFLRLWDMALIPGTELNWIELKNIQLTLEGKSLPICSWKWFSLILRI